MEAWRHWYGIGRWLGSICLAACRGALLLLSSVAMAFAAESVRVPKDDNEVLATVPKTHPSIRSESERLRQRLLAEPNDVEAASALAARYLDAARQSHIELYFGYAEAVMKPWFGAPSLSSSALQVRADIHQHFHRYVQAFDDYKALVARHPRQTDLWFRLGLVSQHMGKSTEANAACRRLLYLDARSWKLCQGYVDSVGPHALRGLGLLRSALVENTASNAEAQIWNLTALAETSERLGKFEDAERYYREALARDSSAPSIIYPYADFLYDAGRDADALNVLSRGGGALGALLRRCLIYQRTRDVRLEPSLEELSMRMERGRALGDLPSFHEEIRAQLYLFNNPRRAVALARENWAMQKTPSDARWLLEAGLGVNDANSLAEVRAWLRVNEEAYPVLAKRLLAHDQHG